LFCDGWFFFNDNSFVEGLLFILEPPDPSSLLAFSSKAIFFEAFFATFFFCSFVNILASAVSRRAILISARPTGLAGSTTVAWNHLLHLRLPPNTFETRRYRIEPNSPDL
jgi:hypothetical protein